MNDDEARALIRLLADPAHSATARDFLEDHVARVRGPLLAALDDPALLVDPPGDDEPGVVHVLYLLSLEPTDAVLARVRELVEHPEVFMRAGAARVLGRAGADVDASRLRELLTDDAPSVREEALIGLALGKEAGRLSAALGAEVFDAVVEALRRSEDEGHPDTPRLLVSLDRERALEALQRPDVLSAEVGPLPYVLDVLAAERVELPVERLLALLTELDARGDSAGKYRDPRAPIIETLGRRKDPRIDDVLRRYSTCKNAYTAFLAAQALCLRRGLDPDGAVADVGEEPTTAPLPHRIFVLAVDFDYHVGNGGFRQLYASRSGRWVRETVEALKAIGATRSAALLERANAEFGPDGPPRDDRARRAALEGMSLKPGEQFLFDSYDEASDAAAEPVMASVYRYVLERPDDFRPRR